MPTLPSITLAPWELPPDCEAPPTAPADFVFRAPWQYGLAKRPRETEIWMRIVPYKTALLYYFCDGERPKNGNWVLGGGHLIPYMNHPVERELIEEALRTNPFLWRQGDIVRLIYFEGAPYELPGLHRLTVAPKGSCRVRIETGDLDDESGNFGVNFHAPFRHGNAPAGAIATKRWLLGTKKYPFGLLSVEGFEGNFALQWLHMPHEEQREKVLSFERGHDEEMHAILRAVLQSQAGIWDQNEPLIWTTNYRASKPRFPDGPSGDEDYLNLFNHVSSYNTPRMPERLKNWKRLVWNYFGPSFDDDLLEYSCVCDSMDSGLFGGIGAFRALVEPPTLHEHLEAQLLLRDWWQQKYTPLFFDSDTPNTPL